MSGVDEVLGEVEGVLVSTRSAGMAEVDGRLEGSSWRSPWGSDAAGRGASGEGAERPEPASADAALSLGGWPRDADASSGQQQRLWGERKMVGRVRRDWAGVWVLVP